MSIRYLIKGACRVTVMTMGDHGALFFVWATTPRFHHLWPRNEASGCSLSTSQISYMIQVENIHSAIILNKAIKVAWVGEMAALCGILCLLLYGKYIQDKAIICEDV